MYTPELVRLYGVVIWDGFLGGRNNALHTRWTNGNAYDEVTCSRMLQRIWL